MLITLTCNKTLEMASCKNNIGNVCNVCKKKFKSESYLLAKKMANKKYLKIYII